MNYRVATGEQGMQKRSLQIDVGKAHIPEREFYANVYRSHQRDGHLVCVFGQLAPTSDSGVVQAEVAIEIPAIAVHMIETTFHDTFRAAATAFDRGPLTAYPTGLVSSTLTYGAALTRILLNDFLALIDFLELVPRANVDPEARPLIRIKCPASMMSLFVSSVDEFVGAK